MSGEWPSTNARLVAISCPPRPGRPRWTVMSLWESASFLGSCTELSATYASLPEAHRLSRDCPVLNVCRGILQHPSHDQAELEEAKTLASACARTSIGFAPLARLMSQARPWQFDSHTPYHRNFRLIC